MTAPPIKNISSATSGKHETAKHWLQRCLRKQPSVQPTDHTGSGGLRDRQYVQRPQTAPSIGTAIDAFTAPAMLAVPTDPINIQTPVCSVSLQRSDSGVVRDVNAWLDASMSTPSPPLMAGLTYWRTTTDPNAKDSIGMQHAIPIARRPDIVRPATSQARQVKPGRTRGKKIVVRMPSLAHNKLEYNTARKQINRRSKSVPVFAIPYEETQPGAPPALMTQSRSFLSSTTREIAEAGSKHSSGQSSDVPLLERSQSRFDSQGSSSLRTSDGSGSIEQRMHAFFLRSSKSGDSTRSSGAAARVTRENSMGEMSEAPTYSSGQIPPSYHSRPASVLTTSSFGCIDGMNDEQRQISQHRAALQRSMKGKIKRFAQNFTT
ncbi:hypothetical protein EK21DRAFT_76062 [Setomelanomma holmii]|uniref:Uncharacterized protein n=1 Tax=Setomelanomma holmii TaxID=210430 RepID=A0A9P4H0W7_9PLEO|nr:hypothetical protein EK21DRAFT_76062 [Setomelanomma holmii]